MFKTFTKLNNTKSRYRIQDANKLNNYSAKKKLNLMKYIKSTKNFRKTTNNFKSNLSLTPFYDEIVNQYRPENGNLLYFNFNKAPSMIDNYRHINNMIKLKRKQRLKDLEQVHNKILISESESYRNKLYITSNDYKPEIKNNLIKSNSCRTIPIKNFKNRKKTNRINTFQKSNNLFTKSFNNNSQKNLGTSLLRNKQILSALSKKDTEKEANYALNTVSKMKMQLIESLHNEFDPKKLVNLEGRLVKFKLIQDIQTKKVKNISIINDFIKEGYLRRLNKLKNSLQKIYETYSKQMHFYLQFLYNKIEEFKEELRIKKAALFDICSIIEKNVIKIINKESELEFLVEIRNFLLKTKERFNKEERPDIYYDLLLIRDSKILIIGRIFDSINFLKEIANRTISKFTFHLQELKDTITNVDGDIDLNEDLFDSLDLGNYKLNQIFTSPEDFIQLYEILTEKDLNLLFLLQESKREKNNLEKYYKRELSLLEKRNESEKTFKNLGDMKKIKEELKNKNELLNKKYIYYNDSLNNKIIPSKIISLKHKGNTPMYLNYNINLSLIKREKYFDKLKNYKYRGLLLLDVLIKKIKYFSQMKYFQNFFDNLQNRNRLYVLDISINSFNEDNVNTINSNILKAISIYEEIYKYVLFIHENLKKNTKNLQFIQKQQNIIDYNNKVEKARMEKEAKIEKDYKEKKKIFEKAVKPILYIETKVNVENKIKRKKVKDDRIKEKEKHFEEDEFNFMAKFSD
jgi:hypothetical protein